MKKVRLRSRLRTWGIQPGISKGLTINLNIQVKKSAIITTMGRANKAAKRNIKKNANIPCLYSFLGAVGERGDARAFQNHFSDLVVQAQRVGDAEFDMG